MYITSHRQNIGSSLERLPDILEQYSYYVERLSCYLFRSYSLQRYRLRISKKKKSSGFRTDDHRGNILLVRWAIRSVYELQYIKHNMLDTESATKGLNEDFFQHSTWLLQILEMRLRQNFCFICKEIERVVSAGYFFYFQLIDNL